MHFDSEVSSGPTIPVRIEKQLIKNLYEVKWPNNNHVPGVEIEEDEE